MVPLFLTKGPKKGQAVLLPCGVPYQREGARRDKSRPQSSAFAKYNLRPDQPECSVLIGMVVRGLNKGSFAFHVLINAVIRHVVVHSPAKIAKVLEGRNAMV